MGTDLSEPKWIALKEGCAFYPYDGGTDKEEFIIRATHERQFRISSLAKQVLKKLDGRTSPEEICRFLAAKGIAISPEELKSLLETQYLSLGILDGTPAGTIDQAKVRQDVSLRIPFLWHWSLIPKTAVELISSHLQVLYGRATVLALLALIAGAHGLVYYGFPHLHTPFHARPAVVFALCVLSILIHEFGHSSAVSRFGGSPGKIGCGLYLLLPSFYADVSEIWRFPRKHRLVVDFGGIYFQQIAFAVFAVVGMAASWSECIGACRVIDIMTLITLNPIFQFDGYWLLVDWLAIPKLQRMSMEYLRFKIASLWRARLSPAIAPLSPGKYVVFIAYAVLCNIFLAASVWAGCRYLHLSFERLFTIVPQVWRSMGFALRVKDFMTSIDSLVTLTLLIAFPATALIGLSKYSIYLTRYFAVKLQVIKDRRRHKRASRLVDTAEPKTEGRIL
jgi:putative peptide zinc metalloprotease protein